MKGASKPESRRKLVCDGKVVLTAINQADPPSLWDEVVPGQVSRPHFDVVAKAAKWSHVREAFVPTSKEVRNQMTMTICIPVYTEEGFTLTRTVEALALQRDDWHKSLEKGKIKDLPTRTPELHAIAIFDGYNATMPDGKSKPIMQPNMRAAVTHLFGGKLDFADVEAMFARGAEHVLIQSVMEAPDNGVESPTNTSSIPVGFGHATTSAPTGVTTIASPPATNPVTATSGAVTNGLVVCPPPSTSDMSSYLSPLSSAHAHVNGTGNGTGCTTHGAAPCSDSTEVNTVDGADDLPQPGPWGPGGWRATPSNGNGSAAHTLPNGTYTHTSNGYASTIAAATGTATSTANSSRVSLAPMLSLPPPVSRATGTGATVAPVDASASGAGVAAGNRNKKPFKRHKPFIQRYQLQPLQVDCRMAMLSDARSGGLSNTNLIGSTEDLDKIRESLHHQKQARQRADAASARDSVTDASVVTFTGIGASGTAFVPTPAAATAAGGSIRASGLITGRSTPSPSPSNGAAPTLSTSEGDTGVSKAESQLSPRSIPDEERDAGIPIHQYQTTTYPIYFSVLIKRRNAKKHHSHRWFFEAFSQVQRIYHGSPHLDYYFCTDVGTLYAPGMLARLWRHMKDNDRCAACCAHQRIMSYSDQTAPDMANAEGPFASMLRSVQAFDFESGLAIFNGVHAALGFLPVIPGPCGIFRAQAVTASILEDVRLICTNPSSRDGIVQGNLKIAEDRILSYLLLLVPGVRGMQYETHWVPSTVFYFESEDNLGELVPQRRRWLNGTVAGYLWLLTNSKLWRAMLCMGVEDDVGEVYHNLRIMPWKVFFLCLLQLLIFTIVYLMPAFLPVTGHLALYGFTALLSTWGAWIPDQALTAMLVAFWFIYFGSFAALTVSSRWGDKAVYARVWHVRVGINAFIMVMNIFVMLGLVVMSNIDPQSLALQIPIADQADLNVAFAATMLYTTSPFLLTLMHSWDSFKMMISAFPAYFLFLPTILADFFAYSVAKLDDWRWGTKGAGVDKANENVLDAKDQRDARSRLATITTSAFGLQLVVAGGFAITNIVLRDLIKHYLIGVGAATAAVGLSTMAMSFLYFFCRAVFQLFCCRVDVPIYQGRVLTSTRYAFAALGESIMKIFTFLIWLCAILAMGFIATSFVEADKLPGQALYLILLMLGLVVVTAVSRYVAEKCQRIALEEQIEEDDVNLRSLKDPISGIEARRRREFRLRGVASCFAICCSLACMPFSFIAVIIIMPINAIARVLKACLSCLGSCCCPVTALPRPPIHHFVDADEGVDEDEGTSLSLVLRQSRASRLSDISHMEMDVFSDTLGTEESRVRASLIGAARSPALSVGSNATAELNQRGPSLQANGVRASRNSKSSGTGNAKGALTHGILTTPTASTTPTMRVPSLPLHPNSHSGK